MTNPAPKYTLVTWKKIVINRGDIMGKVRLGKTEIVTNKNGFGALPIQRISDEEAVKIVRRAFEKGVTFFDTARFYRP